MINKKLILVVAMISILADISFAQDKGDKLFDSSILHELRITSDTEPYLYEFMQGDAMTVSRPYYMVSLDFDGETIDSVGVRAKGGSSSGHSTQTPMKIDINEFVSGQRFDGVKKFGLTNNFGDEERQKHRVCYELFRRAGIASPRTSYVKVYVNDVFIEVYLLVEQIDETFIKENYSDVGSLSKFGEWIHGPGEVFWDSEQNINDDNRLDRVVLRQYLKFLVINTIVRAADNYPGNNFYLYYSEKEDRYHYMPWDYNGGFMDSDWPVLYPLEDGEAIWNDPDKKAILMEVACEIYNYFDDDYLDNLFSTNFDIITSSTQGEEPTTGDYLKSVIAHSKEILLQELTDEGYSCGDFSYPYEEGDLVINEFVAKSDSMGGVQEPDGGTPDWIELYNNTDEDIILNHHFYLSNDVDFPKKWNFRTPVTIPANGYQIVWADRDVHQQGVHTCFKIGKSGGDLMLVYEDMTVIDHVEYDEQELNKGYARVPNGSGDFVIQSHTFNGNNNTSNTSSTLGSDQAIHVYPNPTTESVQVITENAIKSIKVYSVSGQLIMEQQGNNSIVVLNGISSGIYLLHVQTDSQNKVVKLIKK